jgi:ABC-2 type transport system permease protein
MSLVLHQFRFDQKAFWRNPASVFFTVFFPVMLFVILAVITGDKTVHARGGVDATQYYVPAIIVLAVIASTMQTLAMSLVIAREDGRLKRGRGTPMPAWVFVAGRIGNSLVAAALITVVLATVGALWGAPIPWGRLPEIAAVLVVGTASFCCLGIALTALIPSQDAAAPIVNVILFPLYFLSGVFIPENELPNGVLSFADIFPVRHFFEAFFDAYVTGGPGASGVPWGSLALVGLWGLAGLVLAIRFFRWTPRRG